MASEGPLSTGTVTSDSSAGGTAWPNPSNATTADASYAGGYYDPAEHTEYLKCTNFGFAIPAGSTIDGIVAEYKALGSAFDSSNSKDWRVRIVKGGTIGSTDKSVDVGWPGSASYLSRGSSSDLWGETWTVDDINSSTFGVAIAAQDYQYPGSLSSFVAQVDHVRITVYYTAGASGQPAIKRMGGVKFNAGPFGHAQNVRGW